MIVVDASVLANAVGDDGADGEVARRALGDGGALHAPDLVDVETASVLRRAWRRGDLDDERLLAAAVDLADLPVVRHPVRSLVGRALGLRENLTLYDGVYVALAEALGCPLLTADRRLARSPGPTCELVLVSR